MVHSLSAVTIDAQSARLTAQTPGTVQGGATPFEGTIRAAIGQVNELEASATQAVTGLLAGTGIDVHQAMIATQKASMAFELALAVRNKAVQAYQNIMQMQF